MSITVSLGTPLVDQSSLVLFGTLRFSKNINARWTANWDMHDPTGSFRPVVGEPFSIKDGATLIFAGLITDATEAAYTGTEGLGTPLIKWSISAAGWNNVLDHRVIRYKYPVGQPALTIIQDIITNWLTGDGFTLGYNDLAVLNFVPSVLDFDGSSVSQAFDRIRDATGSQWWVDENKAVNWSYAFPVGGVAFGPPLGFSLTGAEGDWLTGTMQVKHSTANYRNVQHVKIGATVSTTPLTQTYVTKNALDWFIATEFPVLSAPTVTVNGVSQTIYQLGVDAYGQNGWYWVPGDFGVQQGQQVAPAAGSVVVITYGSVASQVVTESNATQIAARAAIEGTSGKWENVFDAGDIQDVALGQAVASSLLAQAAIIPDVITFQTYRNNYSIGGYLTVTIPMHDLNGYYNVTQIQAKFDTNALTDPIWSNKILYTITLTNAQDPGNYVKWFEGLISRITVPNQTAGTATAPNTGGTTGGATTGKWIREVPSGTINGTNTTFTLSFAPNPAYVIWLFLNGVAQDPLNGTPEFTLSGTTITYAAAPKTGDKHWVIYMVASSQQVPGQARTFSGSDNVDYGSQTALQITGDASAGVWVKAGSTGVILSDAKNTGGTTAGNDLYILQQSGTDFQYAHESPTGSIFTANFGASLVAGQWYYIGFTRDSSAQKVFLYLGDKNSMTLLATVSYPNALVGGSNTHLTIGNGWDSLATHFDGAIQEHYVWSRQLTQGEHQAAAQGSPSSTNLQLACKMGNTPEVDFSPNAFSGAVTGTTLVAGHP